MLKRQSAERSMEMNENNKIAVYIPAYNSAAFISAVRIPKGVTCVVMDNHSEDGTAEAAEKRGFLVVRNDITVPRVENWLRCVRHFQSSDFDWMKWLFTGDELYENLAEEILRIGSAYPDAGMIIFRYDAFRNGQHYGTWQSLYPGTTAVDSTQAVRDYALHGNIFGSPIGICLRRGVSIPEMDVIKKYRWAADAHLAMLTARNTTVVFSEDCIGAFHYDQRKHYSTEADSFNSHYEEMDSRILALAFCRENGMDEAQYATSREAIQREYEEKIFYRAFVGRLCFRKILWCAKMYAKKLLGHSM